MGNLTKRAVDLRRVDRQYALNEELLNIQKGRNVALFGFALAAITSAVTGVFNTVRRNIY